jgi:hypothetical protein
MYELNETQKVKLDRWLSTRKVAAILKLGGSLSITFTAGNGIGISVTALLIPTDAQKDTLTLDLTDLSSW